MPDLSETARRLTDASVQVAVRGTRAWWRGVGEAERTYLQFLDARMRQAAVSVADAQGAGDGPARWRGAVAMDALLTAGIEQSSREARERFLERIIAGLVPDEARILAVLGDGRAEAVLHVEARTGRRSPVSHATLLGARAGLSVPALAPRYVEHLLNVGLVEVAIAREGLDADYEILLARADVRDALRDAATGRLPARTVKGTVRLSALGTELWRLCHAEA